MHWYGYAFLVLYLLVIAAGVASLRGFRKEERVMMRWRRFCPSCGYDLRATPERCPECGADVRLGNA